ncbi:uncharacterized protein LOC121189280 [Toxotes jaculatrix]|uniref:uncharacterized protein LOC121189280 n=1 Tax=Toxotes jaculatrix TaxID=941984 RepID=UPI001B3AFF84|nr:uncharacterized protein LOC121189280 [Toxotes jaculatrix]
MASQRRLPILLLTLIFCFLPCATWGKKYYSHHGLRCVSECELQGFPQSYQCTVHASDGTEKLEYCSPKRNMDYRGNECLDCCDLHGNDYYWCRTGSSWGYCGDVVESSKHYTSTYSVPCTDSCEQRSLDYYWCHSSQGYDYCSPKQNVDYKGYACREDHPCDKHGNSYYWCQLQQGSWGYCAPVEERAMIHTTKYLKDCIDDCQYHTSRDYFWCNAEGSWDYCSPLPDFTYKGEPCRSDHTCGNHGKNYNWCYTTYNDDWDYCGVITAGECVYSVPQRSKRQPNNPNVICTKEDQNKRRVTVFTAEVNHNAIAEPNNRQRNEAINLINRWDNQGLGDRARSNLIRSEEGNLRLDLQGLINRNNQRYYNLQIQINSARSSRESTTLAQIIVPIDTSAEYMRLAFRESLQRRARITLEVTEQSTSSSNNNQKCRRRH